MEELLALGYTLSFSEACTIKAWGLWHVSFKKENGACVKGYGDTEAVAIADALDLAKKSLTR